MQLHVRRVGMRHTALGGIPGAALPETPIGMRRRGCAQGLPHRQLVRARGFFPKEFTGQTTRARVGPWCCYQITWQVLVLTSGPECTQVSMSGEAPGTWTHMPVSWNRLGWGWVQCHVHAYNMYASAQHCADVW